MATQFYDFYGTFKWIKSREPDEKYDNFSADVYLDDDSWEEFKNSGLQVTPKEDEEGRYVRFRRPNKKIIKDELVKFGPPKVVSTKGEDLADIMVANGATGKAVVVVYDTMKGKGHRLEKIILDTWEKYQKEDPTDVRTMDGHSSPDSGEHTDTTSTTKKKRPF